VTGWGVRDPEGRLLPVVKSAKPRAWKGAMDYLRYERTTRGPGDAAGGAVSWDCRLPFPDVVKGLRALGYRVERVELRSAEAAERARRASR
jgi:hypothetical protein